MASERYGSSKIKNSRFPDRNKDLTLRLKVTDNGEQEKPRKY